MTVQGPPELQGPRRLAPEPRVPPRQRQAHTDTNPVISTIGHCGPSPPRSGTHDDPPLRWLPAPPRAGRRYQERYAAPGSPELPLGHNLILQVSPEQEL